MNSQWKKFVLWLLLVFGLSGFFRLFQPLQFFIERAHGADVWEGFMMLRRVASCESTGDVNKPPRQFNDDGSPLWGNDPKTGKPIKRDAGLLQINTKAHAQELKLLNLDVVHSEMDNIIYGKILYQREGLRPWTQSKKCWSGAT